jgi:hypothetical protein
MDTNTILIFFLIIIISLIMLFKTHITIIDTQTVPVPVKNPIGGCAGTRYRCCSNGITARMNPVGTNC